MQHGKLVALRAVDLLWGSLVSWSATASTPTSASWAGRQSDEVTSEKAFLVCAATAHPSPAQHLDVVSFHTDTKPQRLRQNRNSTASAFGVCNSGVWRLTTRTTALASSLNKSSLHPATSPLEASPTSRPVSSPTCTTNSTTSAHNGGVTPRQVLALQALTTTMPEDFLAPRHEPHRHAALCASAEHV